MGRHDHPYLEAIREVPLFAGCSRHDLHRLAERAQPLKVQAGNHLMLEHYRGELFLLLLEGNASVQRGEVEIAEVGPGDFVGELGLLDHADRSATVVATTPVKALYWEQDAFDEVIQRIPNVAARIRAEADRRRGAGQAGQV